MATLRDVKRRITSVEKMQQITRAMRMVAAAKLRRAQAAIESGRPYAERMRETLVEVAAGLTEVEHPLLTVHDEIKAVELIVVVSDRGLAGAFNNNVLKEAERQIKASADKDVTITAVGRKAGDYFRVHHPSKVVSSSELPGWVHYSRAVEIAKGVSERYEKGELDRVVLVYSEFLSVLTQTPRTVQLLPFSTSESSEAEAGDDEGGEDALQHEIEPSPEELLRSLVPKAVEVEVFRALLENQAGEHAARMTAMESATRNSEEMIESLTLQYNRARQASITRELVEIVTGAQALE